MQKALKISQSNDVSSVAIFGFFEKQIQKMKIFLFYRFSNLFHLKILFLTLYFIIM
jgi:hypothetical protein